MEWCSIPWGVTTLTPNAVGSTGLVEASFKAQISAYPVIINSTHSAYIGTYFLFPSNVKLTTVSKEATNTKYAVASLTFNYSSPGGSRTWYLTLEINVSGNTRITWVL